MLSWAGSPQVTSSICSRESSLDVSRGISRSIKVTRLEGLVTLIWKIGRTTNERRHDAFIKF